MPPRLRPAPHERMRYGRHRAGAPANRDFPGLATPDDRPVAEQRERAEAGRGRRRRADEALQPWRTTRAAGRARGLRAPLSPQTAERRPDLSSAASPSALGRSTGTRPLCRRSISPHLHPRSLRGLRSASSTAAPTRTVREAEGVIAMLRGLAALLFSSGRRLRWPGLALTPATTWRSPGEGLGPAQLARDGGGAWGLRIDFA